MSDSSPTLISIRESTPAAIMASKAGIKMRLISDWIMLHVKKHANHACFYRCCGLSSSSRFLTSEFDHRASSPRPMRPVSSWDHGTCFCWFTLHGAALVSYIYPSYEGNSALVSRGSEVQPQKLLMWKWEQLWCNSGLQTGIKRAEKCKYWPNETG